MRKKVLVIGAHPDDETFGVGGTIAKYSSNSDIVHVLLITDGSSSQYENFEEMIKRKKNEAKKAMEVLGVEKIEFNTLPDMQLDTVSHIKINSIIEKKISDFNPNIVYTHFWGDVNKDHRMIFESTIVATRPGPNNKVSKVLGYETSSSTEWQSPKISDRFIPTVFVDISDHIETKIKAVECYKSELREYPHPRSPEAVRIYSRRNGINISKEAAERFILIREII